LLHDQVLEIEEKRKQEAEKITAQEKLKNFRLKQFNKMITMIFQG
jgi:hypothetical protein